MISDRAIAWMIFITSMTAIIGLFVAAIAWDLNYSQVTVSYCER